MAPAVRGVSFDLHRGEILGLGGLIGAGRTELLRAVKLVNREVPVLNLNSIAIQNDYVFIGEDHELYFLEKEKHEVYHIGSAQDLSNIKLASGIKLDACSMCTAGKENGGDH